MHKNEQIEISLSKNKLLLILLGVIVFVAIGFWFVIYQPVISNPIFGNPTIILAVGIASIFLFGLIGVIISRKLFDKKLGLIITKQGIIDNSSGLSNGLILWDDVIEIRVAKVMSQKFIMLILKDPQGYIESVTSKFKRNGMQMNYKQFGSPISISANALKINFEALHKLLTEKITEYKS